jgi:hypothetical protein
LIWINADDQARDRMLARAVEHALNRKYVDLPRLVSWLVEKKFRLLGTVVYFDLVERLGEDFVCDKSSPDSKVTVAVARWLEEMHEHSLTELKRTLFLYCAKPEHRGDEALTEAVRELLLAH